MAKSKTSPAAASPAPVEKKVEEVPPVAAAEETAPEVAVEVDKFQAVLEKLQSFVNDAKELITTVKTLQKEHAKLQKASSKKTRKVAADGAKRSPSGFAKPTKLSDELCDFLGVERGSSMARTIVTKHINEYIKTNNLQDQKDKRNINPDAKLKAILAIKESDKLTYFNLQTYIKQHFKKE